jgi:hypothetical protein
MLMLSRVVTFYLDGFRNMRLGRTLWKIILIKLVIMFAVLKWLFFPDVLKITYDTDAARAEHVLQRLTQKDVNGG